MGGPGIRIGPEGAGAGVGLRANSNPIHKMKSIIGAWSSVLTVTYHQLNYLDGPE